MCSAFFIIKNPLAKGRDTNLQKFSQFKEQIMNERQNTKKVEGRSLLLLLLNMIFKNQFDSAKNSVGFVSKLIWTTF